MHRWERWPTRHNSTKIPQCTQVGKKQCPWSSASGPNLLCNPSEDPNKGKQLEPWWIANGYKLPEHHRHLSTRRSSGHPGMPPWIPCSANPISVSEVKRIADWSCFAWQNFDRLRAVWALARIFSCPDGLITISLRANWNNQPLSTSCLFLTIRHRSG